MSDRAIAEKLLNELDILVKNWLNYFKEKKISSLDSFNGVFCEYVDVKIFKEAVSVINDIFRNKPDSNLQKRIIYVESQFDKLFNVYSEYFDHYSDEIKDIAYRLYSTFKNRNSLFIELNSEKLSFFLKATQNEKHNYLLWKENNHNKNK